MRPLDLTRFDLNLLVVLEALWAERQKDCICPNPQPATPYRGCAQPLMISFSFVTPAESCRRH